MFTICIGAQVDFLENANVFLTLFFLCEMLLKIFACGILDYLAEPFNRFDVSIPHAFLCTWNTRTLLNLTIRDRALVPQAFIVATSVYELIAEALKSTAEDGGKPKPSSICLNATCSTREKSGPSCT
jgi:hypothetical protein